MPPKAIFLTSGQSSRMQPISDKNMLNFGGQPLIKHIMGRAKKAGIDNFVVVVNKFNRQQISNELVNWKGQITIAEQTNLNDGLGGGVAAGLEYLKDDDEILVLGGNDCVEPEAYTDVLSIDNKWSGGILAQEVKAYFPGGYIEIDKEGKIKNIIEKPKPGAEPSSLVSIVVHYFRQAGDLKKALKQTNNNADNSYEKALKILFTTNNYCAVPYKQKWQAIKYPWHVLEMMKRLSFLPTSNKKTNAIHSSAQIANSAKLNGGLIIIEKEAKIMDYAIIQGPAYIGERSIVCNHTLIRETNIGKDNIIGNGSEISRSWLGDNVSTHNALIADSVIDDGVNFGIFSATTNLRLDKKTIKVKIKENLIDSKKTKLGSFVGANAQIGSHASLMPGSKVNKESLIFPNTIHK